MQNIKWNLRSKEKLAELVYNYIQLGTKGAITKELLQKTYTAKELEIMYIELENKSAYKRNELHFTPLLKKNTNGKNKI